MYGGEHYTIDGGNLNVVPPPIFAADVATHSTYYQFPHYEVAQTQNIVYSPAPLPESTSQIVFRNPFEFPSAYLPYANQPRASLDPLQWDLAGFST